MSIVWSLPLLVQVAQIASPALLPTCLELKKFFPKIGPLVGSWQTDTGQEITFSNNYSFSVGGAPAGAWFPMANGAGAMKWNGRDMVDLLSLGADGNTLGVQNIEGANSLSGELHNHLMNQARPVRLVG